MGAELMKGDRMGFKGEGRSLFIFFLLGLSPFSLWGQSFGPIVQPMGGAEKIVIKGFKGVLEIVPTNSKELKVEARKTGSGEATGWSLRVGQRLNNLEVEMKKSGEHEHWEVVRRGQNLPAFKVKVTAPVYPMEVFWQEGEVEAKGLQSSLSLQMNRGKARFKGGEGALRVQLLRGDLEVSEHQGSSFFYKLLRERLVFIKTRVL